MLDLNYLRNHKEEALNRLSKRCNDTYPEFVEKAIEIDAERRRLQVKLDALLAEINKSSKEIGGLMKNGQHKEADSLKKNISSIKQNSQELKDEMNQLQENLKLTLYQIPNVPQSEVPKGRNEDDNEVIFTHGEIENKGEDALPHWDLAAKYDLIDFELGVKITGAGFPVYRGAGSKLQRALINFFLDEASAAGYKEVTPPLVVNEESGYGTGQLPDKEGQMYHIQNENFYLIPTAEVPLTNIYRDVIVSKAELPIKITGYTPCFRREAGSYGKDVRGLNRLHQFDKVEIVQITEPSKSHDQLKEMIEHVKSLLIMLNLPFRILRLCGGDLGFAAAITYDFEVYSAAQGRWLEVSSVSNFETYQSNRLKCRYRNKEKETVLVHTLNGSALALPRIVAALLENHQTHDGINIPECLQTYLGFNKIS